MNFSEYKRSEARFIGKSKWSTIEMEKHLSRRRCPSLFLTPRDDYIRSRRELIAASHLQYDGEEKRSRIEKAHIVEKLIRPNNRSQIISDPRFDLSVRSFACLRSFFSVISDHFNDRAYLSAWNIVPRSKFDSIYSLWRSTIRIHFVLLNLNFSFILFAF